MASRKSTTELSALCIVVPEGSRPPIDDLRARFDRQADIWPPHINILYPFVDREQFAEGSTRLSLALTNFAPFSVRMGPVQCFKQRMHSSIAWLEPRPLSPSPADALQSLHSICQSTFPGCCDAERHRDGFIPHLTVGQCEDSKRFEVLKKAAGRLHEPVEFQVSEVCFISRVRPDEPFLCYWRMQLGKGTAAEDSPPRSLIPPKHCTSSQRPHAGTSESTRDIPITLASNTNRSERSIAKVPPQVSLVNLQDFAKRKLRIKAKHFYTQSGQLLADGDSLSANCLVLASRGEDFVGKALVNAEVDALDAFRPPQREGPDLPPPYEREFLKSPVAGGAPQIRLLQFNMLASHLALGSKDSENGEDDSQQSAQAVHEFGVHSLRVHTKNRYSRQLVPFRCSQDYLDWGYRKGLVSRELLQYDPDLLCLQEVSPAQLNYCQELLRPRGYRCDSCNSAPGRGCLDCVMFWREDRLRAVGEAQVVQMLPKDEHPALLQRLELVPDFSPDGVGKNEGLNFLVVTAHLKAGVSRDCEEQRERQVESLLGVIDAFALPGEAVILAGDLNAHRGPLPKDAAVTVTPRVLPQLDQAAFRCAFREGSGGEVVPRFTYWAGWRDRDVLASFDHVLLRGSGVEAVSALQAPDAQEIAASQCRLPNARHPSDHLPMVVDLEMSAARCCGDSGAPS